MAIIVQQDKAPINWFSVIAWFSVIGIIFSAGYYLFFVRPPLVEFVLPIKFAETATLAKIKFDPNFLIESEVFKVLEKGEYGKISLPSLFGRDNPFLNFAPQIKLSKAPVNIKPSTSTSTATSTQILLPKSSATSSLSLPQTSISVSTSSVPQLPVFIPPVPPSSSPQ
ncbi:MAG: hypothetical protein AAB772_01895 [Patescibacteria group bacterium]